MVRWVKLGLCSAVLTTTATGCIAPQQDDADKFREPIPTTQDVSLAFPGSSGAGGATKSVKTTGTGSGSATGYAEWYQFTRNVADGVDWGTALILGSVWIVVHTPPTTITSKQATWGPGQGDALSPVVWRLVVTEVADHEFDYELDGRPKDSTSDADYLAVWKGHGFGKAHPEHRNGWFVLDGDAYAKLDPMRAKDRGTTKVTHHLSSWPATLAVELRPSSVQDWIDVTVTHQKDGSGAVDLNGLTDIEDVKDGNPEDVVVHSRWASSGAGRADVQASGGSLPVLVKASECWSSSFVRSYYADNVGHEPTEGSADACAFSDTQF